MPLAQPSGLSAADYDTKLVNFYLEVVEEISEKVYLNTSFSPSQKLEWYEENKYESFLTSSPVELLPLRASRGGQCF